MTALTMSARPGHDAGPRPVPWRRMAWVTWRQHRIALAGVAALLGAWAVYLWLTGFQVRHAYAAVAACHPASSIACGSMISSFRRTYMPSADALPSADAATIFMQAAPALIGAFVGAPLLARELETGTFRYAWTQGIGRRRWTLGKLVPLAIALAAAAGACSVLYSWYSQPFIAEGLQTPLDPKVFGLRGVAFAAWTLAAFAIGALAGLLTRRVVPAMAATLAAYAGLALAAGLWLRQHYAVPLITSNPNVPGSAWIMSQWWTKGGTFAGQPSYSLLMQLCPPSAVGPGQTSGITPARCLAQHGYTQWTSYQPVTRFWPFHWIEGGWLLALSLLLIAATIWLIRRRAA